MNAHSRFPAGRTPQATSAMLANQGRADESWLGFGVYLRDALGSVSYRMAQEASLR